MRLIGVFLTFLLVPVFIAADFKAYQVFSGDGELSNFESVVKAAKKADVVLFGEFHSNPICHWLQLELSKELHEKLGDKLVLAGEMFESDNQLILDEYLSGQITTRKYESEMRLWPNYKTDYKPLIEFAKEKELNVIATNIPRRYAGVVAKNGLDALNNLTDQAKSYIAPLPIVVDTLLPNYKAFLSMNMGAHGTGQNLMRAQAIKDATMAHFILKDLKKKQLVLHFNGNYHSMHFEGIYWYLKQMKPDLNVLTIGTQSQDELSILEIEEGRKMADFVIVTPENMTQTY